MVRKIELSAASLFALERLKEAGSAALHSAYRNTVNLMTPEGLLALQTAGSPLSPVSLVTPLDTDGMETLAALAARETAVMPDGTLRLGGSSGIILARGPRTLCYDPRVPRLPRSRVPALSEAALSVLRAADGRGLAALYGGALPGDPVTAAAADRLEKARAAAAGGRYEEAAAALTSLTGLGGGLTPSGDDLLCGAAAVVCAAGLQDSPFGKALLSGIRASLSRTNDISAAFLACAADGLASEAVTILLAGGEDTDIPRLRELFFAIGHSSGVDSLCGIDTVFTYMKEGWI